MLYAKTESWTQQCWVGDSPEQCRIACFVDASFAGDIRDSKSTSGMYLALIGPNTFVPITWFCKKQGAVSHSSSEAELNALDAAIRLEGIPALLFWDIVVGTLCPDHQGPGRPGAAGGFPEDRHDFVETECDSTKSKK